MSRLFHFDDFIGTIYNNNQLLIDSDDWFEPLQIDIHFKEHEVNIMVNKGTQHNVMSTKQLANIEAIQHFVPKSEKINKVN